MIQKVTGAPTGQIWDTVNIKINSDAVVEQTQGDSERQGSLVCCSSWGCKESDTT